EGAAGARQRRKETGTGAEPQQHGRGELAALRRRAPGAAERVEASREQQRTDQRLEERRRRHARGARADIGGGKRRQAEQPRLAPQRGPPPPGRWADGSAAPPRSRA